MLKAIRKILLSALSILALSSVVWLLLLLNPSWLYGHATQFGNITVYHQQELAPQTEAVFQAAIDLVATSEIYDSEAKIDLCMNDGSLYPRLWIYKGGIAYSFMNKSVMYASTPDFANNVTRWRWPVNDNQERSWNLTELLAHEFVHVLQYHQHTFHSWQHDRWKTEGYAEYISRCGRGALREHIRRLSKIDPAQLEGIPWVSFSDGSGTGLFYFERWLAVQYLIEVKGMTYEQIIKGSYSLEEAKSEMLQWAAES